MGHEAGPETVIGNRQRRFRFRLVRRASTIFRCGAGKEVVRGLTYVVQTTSEAPRCGGLHGDPVGAGGVWFQRRAAAFEEGDVAPAAVVAADALAGADAAESGSQG